jgi:glycosyltransferase involved in cell wall biosynthesis
MRVALVTTSFGTSHGGLQTCTRELAAGLLRHGVEVDVIALADGDEVDGWPADVPAPAVRRLGFVGHGQFRASPGLIASAARMSRRCDVIHAFDAHTPTPAALLVAGDARVVLTPAYHGPAVKGIMQPAHARFVRAVCSRSDRIVCSSSAERTSLTQAVPGLADRAVVIHPGHATPSLPPTHASPSAGGRLLIVSRLVAYKRIELALETLALLPPTFRLTIVGTGPERHRLLRAAQRHGVTARVTWLPSAPAPALQAVYADHDILVSLSTRESLGLVLIDALAAGLNVVASDIPAHREVVQRWSRHGVLTDTAEASAVAAVTVAAASACRPATADPLPTWRDYVDQHVALYELLLSARPHP